jgi:E3 ubiquitin-protein ligase CCNP1IP1
LPPSVYQEYLAKSLTDKYATLNTQMEKIIHDANSEISNLRNKMIGKVIRAPMWILVLTLFLTENIAMSADQDALRRKNEELGQSLRDKNRKLLQTQELYDKMKRRGMLDQVQNAASNAVDDTIQATVTGGGSANSDNGHNLRPQPGLFANQQNSTSHHSGGFKNITMQPPQVPRRRSGDWPAFNSQMGHGKEDFFQKDYEHKVNSRLESQFRQTPSSHRQPIATGNLPNPQAGISNIHNNQISTTPLPRTASGRSPLSSFNTANGQPPGFVNCGIRAGLKVGNPGTPATGGFGRPLMRSGIFFIFVTSGVLLNPMIVAQRSASNLPFTRDSGLGTSSIPRGNYY